MPSATKKFLVFSTAAGFRAIWDSAGPDKKKRERERERERNRKHERGYGDKLGSGVTYERPQA